MRAALVALALALGLAPAQDAPPRVAVTPVNVPLLVNRERNPFARLELPGESLPAELELDCGGWVRRLWLAPAREDGGVDAEAPRGALPLEEVPLSVIPPLATFDAGELATTGTRLFRCDVGEARAPHGAWLLVELSPSTPLDARVRLRVQALTIAGETHRLDRAPEDWELERARVRGEDLSQRYSIPELWELVGHRVALRLRHRGDDGSEGYRIPGLARTKAGALLAIYDVRRDGQRDLQGDIDIGLSRSTDGGASWEPMRVVLDMGEHGGLPERFNGVSDACVLVDDETGRVFVFGCWMHGLRDDAGRFRADLTADSEDWSHQWHGGPKGSGPGLTPRETAQLVVTTSDDDGVTWSAPRLLTVELKDPAWYLLAPAPGNGITTGDGTLVVPAQGRDAEQRTFSTVMVSRDHGETWTLGGPARLDTTECAVVELADGALMLNMRDNRNRKDKSETNGRAVAVSNDLGATWRVHPTDHRADLLPEPVCMASLLRVTTPSGARALVFSNPADRRARRHLTLKASVDDGRTWQPDFEVTPEGLVTAAPRAVELDALGGMYSSLAQIDAATLGVLYESSQGYLVFQRVPLRDLRLE
ncbi:MAG: exo-alpha-sialidase [Planctomycetes bacterium]|nr:exo-alpha-sialidase [Planctomycetota bacterium]